MARANILQRVLIGATPAGYRFPAEHRAAVWDGYLLMDSIPSIGQWDVYEVMAYMQDGEPNPVAMVLTISHNRATLLAKRARLVAKDDYCEAVMLERKWFYVSKPNPTWWDKFLCFLGGHKSQWLRGDGYMCLRCGMRQEEKYWKPGNPPHDPEDMPI